MILGMEQYEKLYSSIYIVILELFLGLNLKVHEFMKYRLLISSKNLLILGGNSSLGNFIVLIAFNKRK